MLFGLNKANMSCNSNQTCEKCIRRVGKLELVREVRQ